MTGQLLGLTRLVENLISMEVTYWKTNNKKNHSDVKLRVSRFKARSCSPIVW